MPDHLNFLVIQTDQMSAKALATYGHNLTKTPHIDRLAQSGTIFENAYCNFPLCVPSRASMLTGRYANSIGVWDNASELPASIPTLAHYLRSEGYYTVLSGKMHFIGPDQLHGFNERITTDIYPSNFAWTPDWIAGERYRPTGINMRAVVDSGVCTRSLQIDYDEEVEFASTQKLYDLARYNTESPFLLWISFTHPHSPYITTPEYWNRYQHDQISMPDVPELSLDKMDIMSRWLYFAHAGDLHEITEEHILNARHAYFGMCSYLDDKIGHLLNTLEQLELDSNTVVILTSDHGEMLGERGMWFKQAFFEWSTKVPLLIRVPRMKSVSRVKELVSLVDLFPTLIEFAGSKPKDTELQLDGHSLVPLLSGSSAWDNQVISEYTGEGVNTPCRMIRKNQHKLIYTHGHPSLLYNLSNDPNELTNVIDEPEQEFLKKSLLETLLEDWDPYSIHESCIQSQRERRLIHEATGGEPEWVYSVRNNDDKRYVRNSSAIETKAKARYPYVNPTPFLNE
ncbi:MAG: choline-sulfatase [Gammaproteobacteria bacterium]|nr:choline-sulfatase [Gammaproteobacteria bacterium]MCY4218802.1 choline-sulfatase [Gammaproteobacteria bacterium]MCY4274995.1 choline-sulfatase [Gammaproteobacteria bacterium]